MTTDSIGFFRSIFKGGDGKFVSVLIKRQGPPQTIFIPRDDWSVAHKALIQERSDAHIFYGIGLFDRPPAQGRGTSSDVSLISAFYWDVDVAADDLSIYADRPTPRVTAQDIEAAFSAIGLPVTAVTSTGNGFHAYIAFETPLTFASDEERERAAGLWNRLTTYVRDKLSHTGWKIDNVADLARLDRLIGSTNHKGDIPKPVTLDIFNPTQVHRIEDLEALAPLQVPTPVHRRLDEPDYERPEALADFTAIHAACTWVQHCVRDADKLSEPEWFGLLRVLAHCKNGEELAHQYSQPYPGYSKAETAKKFQHARQSKPPLYSYIRSILDEEPDESFGLYGTAKSPISLGYMEPELAAMLARYAYVASEDRFVRLDTFERRQKNAFDSENLHRKGIKSPSGAFLRSPLAIKAQRQDYLPGQARLVSDGSGGLLLNSHRPSEIVPKAGEWSTIQGHFTALFPDEGDRNAIYDRFAMAVQKPGTKIKSGVLIFGPEGGGKGTLIEMLAALVGRSNVVTLPSSAIDDPFQNERVNRQAVVFNEVSGIRKAAVNSLKELVTEETIMVQGKGIPRFSGRTPRQVWATTNDEAALQINSGDRRWLVLKTPDAPPPADHFDALYEALPSELPAFAHWLSQRDLSAFKPNERPPVTSAKLEMIHNAASPLEHVIREAMDARIGVFQKDFGTPEDVIRAVMANGWMGRPLHTQTVSLAMTQLGFGSLGRIVLPNGTRPTLRVWRNPERWVGADRGELLDHMGIIEFPLSKASHPDIRVMIADAQEGVHRLAS